jgi:hypothetical protein
MKPRMLLSWLLAAGFGISCGLLVSRDEVARSTSPSGEAVAVVVEGNGGATTSFWYDVYVVEPGADWREGEHVAYLYGAVRSEVAYGVSLRWAGLTSLDIAYLRAREAQLKEASFRLAGRTWNVKLTAGVLDGTAPPGGMLYNLQGRPYG